MLPSRLVRSAVPVLGKETPLGLPAYRHTAPAKASTVLADELPRVPRAITRLVGPGHAALAQMAQHAFAAPGKAVRPSIVLLIALATNGLSAVPPDVLAVAPDSPLSTAGVLLDPAPLPPLPTEDAPAVWPRQRRLAEITEVIHVATLLHDDVIDGAPLRRGQASAPAAFGQRRAVFAGNFLLGRASAALARLRAPDVVQLVATVIDHLVEGELMQLRAQSQDQAQAQAAHPDRSPAAAGPSQARFDDYLAKTYLKTAALIAKSAQASAMLGGHCASYDSYLTPAERERSAQIRTAAFEYGKNLGIAFQLIDDVLDVRATQEQFGKPSGGADLRLGLATGPVLFAWQQLPHSPLGTLVQRKFSQPGDVPLALELVAQSDGVQRTAALAKQYVQKATDAILVLPPSPARDALVALATTLLQRAK